MAEKLEAFDFLSAGGGSTRWSEFLDGNIWRLVPGVDFNDNARLVQARAYSAARARGLKVRTTTAPDGSVIIQAFSPNGDGHAT